MFHGIRSLDQFTHGRRLVRTLPITSLKGATLGVDASYFIIRALNAANHREPLLNAVGGFPAGLEASLDSFVQGLKSQDIEVVFVFKGLTLPPSDKPFPKFDPLASNRENAWSLYTKGDVDQSVMAFHETRFFDAYGNRQLLTLLIQKKIRYIVAPFTANAQLAAMSVEIPSFSVNSKVNGDGSESFNVTITDNAVQEPLLDVIYASTDVMVYPGVDRVISSIDIGTNGANPSSGTFQYISKRSILAELNVNNEQFAELAVTVGCELNRATFPVLNSLVAANPNSTFIKVAADLLQSHGGSMLPAIMAVPPPLPDADSVPYFIRFQKAMLCIDHQPVLYPNGLVWPIKFDEVPMELHEIIGQRLPDELFFYLSRGLVGPELLKALSQGLYVENVPSDGGDALEYRNYVSGPIIKLLSKALSYLTQVLHRYYQYKSIKAVAWYQPTAEVSFQQISPPLYVSIGRQWRVTDSVIDKVLASGQSSEPKEGIVSLGGLIQLLESNEKFVEESATPTPKGTIVTFTTDREILFNTYARALQTLEFIKDDHTLSPWGQVLAAALSHNNNSGAKFAEQLVTVIGLLKEKLVHGEPFKPPYPGGPIGGSIEDKSHALLVSRLATLLRLRYTKPYTGPLSRSLLSYHSVVSKQIQTQRILFESVLISLLANGDADRLAREDDEQWWSLIKEMPFSSSPGSANGVAMKTYLDEYAVKQDKAAAKKALETSFEKSQDVLCDVSLVFDFWDCIMAGVEVGKQLSIIDASVASDMSKTNAWLEPRRF